MRNWIRRFKEKVYLASIEEVEQVKEIKDVQVTDVRGEGEDLDRVLQELTSISEQLSKIGSEFKDADKALVRASSLITTKEHQKKASIQEALLKVRRCSTSVEDLNLRIRSLFVNKLK